MQVPRMPLSRRVETPRLTLLACDREMIEAAMWDRERLARLSGVTVPDAWPARELAEALPLLAATVAGDADADGWQVWLIVWEGTVVGDVGCHGKPSDEGCVEIGFSILPEMRGRGFATEATAAFVRTLAADPRVHLVAARTDESNASARKVLEAAGLRLVGHDGRHLRYELRP